MLESQFILVPRATCSSLLAGAWHEECGSFEAGKPFDQIAYKPSGSLTLAYEENFSESLRGDIFSEVLRILLLFEYSLC